MSGIASVKVSFFHLFFLIYRRDLFEEILKNKKLHKDLTSTDIVVNLLRASLVAQLVKNLPAVQEAQVQSLVQEDPLEKEMATHSSILAW